MMLDAAALMSAAAVFPPAAAVRTTDVEMVEGRTHRKRNPLRIPAGSPVQARVGDRRAHVRVWIVARPGHQLGPLAAQVRQAVGATVERLLGLELGDVTVVVDGVGSRRA